MMSGSGRTLLIVAALLLGGQLGGAYLLGRKMLDLDLARAAETGAARAEQLALATAPALRFGRERTLAMAAEALGRHVPELLAVRFERADGGVVHEWQRGPLPDPAGIARAEAPVRGADGVTLGRVVLLSDQRPIVLQATRHYQAVSLMSVLGASALAALAYALLRRRERRFRAVEEATLALARRDPLTGLLNRRGLADAMDDGGFGHGEPMALALADLDRFKPVNDAYGHAAGDQLLRELAWRLGQAVGPGGVAARLGGDEFAVLAPLDDHDPERGVEVLAARLLAVVERPFTIRPGAPEDEEPGVPVHVGLSLGIAVAPADAAEASELMRRADAALYRAKAGGRGQWRRFAPEMDPRCGTRRGAARVEAELREVLGKGGLLCHYQPIRALRGGALAGFEALARWPHAGRGLVPPSEFIPIAESSGLIGALTEQLLRAACRDAAAWPDGATLSFNLSPLQLRDRALPGVVAAALGEGGLAPSRLQLELTEGALVGDMRLGREILEELRGMGVRLALDDFGTGYSGLKELQALPFDTLKVDASFVRAMAVEGGARKIVAAVIGLGESLGLRVVAEGVEEERDAEALRRLGCGYGQGWLYGRPMPQHQALELARLRVAA
jgi:diguanylate cyclase (GGDEF)-like protein